MVDDIINLLYHGFLRKEGEADIMDAIAHLEHAIDVMVVRKYKISAEIIGSLFLIVLCALILLALYQSGGCVVIAIFLSSVYTLLLMSCVAIVVYVLCKINAHWNPDELYLVIAIRGNMSYRRLKQVHFFLLGMAFSGFVYSNIYLILNM